jgi:hypothetical protein
VVSDQARRELYDVLERRLGEGPATTMMELLPPVGWADVARQSDLTALRGEMAELRAEIRSQLPRLYVANVGLAFATAGLVLAAAKLT